MTDQIDRAERSPQAQARAAYDRHVGYRDHELPRLPWEALTPAERRPWTIIGRAVVDILEHLDRLDEVEDRWRNVSPRLAKRARDKADGLEAALGRL